MTHHAPRALLLSLLLALVVGCAGSQQPRVSFGAPADGANVASPVPIIMAAEHFTIEPAGDSHEGAGHLHVMIDTPCLPPGQVIPKDDAHRHFGDGSTTAELELAPGRHTLCLQAADGAHVALAGAGMTHTIAISVP